MITEAPSENATPRRRLQADRVEDLAPIEAYAGTGRDTHLLIQGEAGHFSPLESDLQGMYTFGGGPCVILPMIARGAGGEACRVALAHVDDFVSDAALAGMFRPMQGTARLEVSLIGGSEQLATRVLAAADKAGATVKFAAANFDESRVDDVAIDRSGRVYRGLKDFSDSPQMQDVVQRLQDLERDASMSLDKQLSLQALGLR